MRWLVGVESKGPTSTEQLHLLGALDVLILKIFTIPTQGNGHYYFILQVMKVKLRKVE